MISLTSLGGALQAQPLLQINDNFVDRGANGLNAFFIDLGLPGWVGDIVTVLIILVIGYIIAAILRAVITKAINATGFGRRAQTSGGNIGKAFGKAAFWLTLLYTLFIALTQLDFASSALSPVEGLLGDIGRFIPKLLAAGLITFVGYLVARVAKTATTATLDAAGVDGFMNRSGVTQATGATGSMSNALGTIVFVLIIVPVIIAALDVLDIRAISEPLTGLLENFLEFIPRIIGAAIVLGLTILIARFVKNFLEGILPTFGFDRSVNEVMMLDDGQAMSTSPSKIAGTIAFIIITVLGLASAISVLGIETLDNAFQEILGFGALFLRAAIFLIVGVFLANFLERVVSGATGSSIGRFLKYAIIFLVGFLALAQLDARGEIVPSLFQAIVIAGSVAAAIAFGVGGTNWAKDVLNSAAPPKKVGSSIQSSTSKTASAVKSAAARVGSAPTKATTKPRTRTTKAAPRVTPKTKK